MRLIDADTLKQIVLGAAQEPNTDLHKAELLCKAIDMCPTVFTKDVVIEELEKHSRWEGFSAPDEDGYIDDYYSEEVIDTDVAIEIVEKGGVE